MTKARDIANIINDANFGGTLDVTGVSTLSGLAYPSSDGSANQFIKTNGSGALSFATVDLTALSASNLTSGTVPDARFPSTLPAISGANLTNLDATDLTGTIASARVSGAYTGITSVGTLTSFRSTGIDDNANAVAITIDSSENVMVGTTNSLPGIGNTDQGISLRTITGDASGIAASRADGISGYFNRNADGDILSFGRSGVSRGTLGVRGGDATYIQSTSNSRTGLDFAGSILPRYNGALSNGTTALGASSYRFSDLYLSGGVYLGGTGSANKLSDVEEGSWIPSSSDAGGSYYSNGKYVKVGGSVFIQATVGNLGGGIDFGSLPFVPSVDSGMSLGQIYQVNYPSGAMQLYCHVNTNSKIKFTFSRDTGIPLSATSTDFAHSSCTISISGFYTTTA